MFSASTWWLWRLQLVFQLMYSAEPDFGGPITHKKEIMNNKKYQKTYLQCPNRHGECASFISQGHSHASKTSWIFLHSVHFSSMKITKINPWTGLQWRPSPWHQLSTGSSLPRGTRPASRHGKRWTTSLLSRTNYVPTISSISQTSRLERAEPLLYHVENLTYK